MSSSVVAIVLATLVTVGPSSCLGGTMTADSEPEQMPRLGLSLIYETEHSLKLAFDYLLGSQQANGSWKHDPAITAMVLYGFLGQPSYRPDERTDKALERGLAYLETFVKPDGGHLPRTIEELHDISVLAGIRGCRGKPVSHDHQRCQGIPHPISTG